MSDIDLTLLSDEEGKAGGSNDRSRRSKKINLEKVNASKEELNYRKKNMESVMETEKAGCTSCGKQLVNSLFHFSHPILDVLLCKVCSDFYGEGEFSVDEDGTDKYCRWCGQGGTLYLCSKCNFGFCRACIKRNLPRSVLKDVEEDDWKCFACQPRPLWKLRAVCVKALELSKIKQKKNRTKSAEKTKSKKSTQETDEYLSSDSEEQQKPRRSRKRTSRYSSSKSSDTSVKKKRKRKDSESEESLGKKKKRSSDHSQNKIELKQYSKCFDQKTTLSSKAAENLLSKLNDQMKNLDKVLSAITSEKNKLMKEDFCVESMITFTTRKNTMKKLFMFQKLTFESLEQAFENISLTYKNGLINSTCETVEDKSTSNCEKDENKSELQQLSDSAKETEKENQVKDVDDESFNSPKFNDVQKISDSDDSGKETHSDNMPKNDQKDVSKTLEGSNSTLGTEAKQSETCNSTKDSGSKSDGSVHNDDRCQDSVMESEPSEISENKCDDVETTIQESETTTSGEKETCGHPSNSDSNMANSDNDKRSKMDSDEDDVLDNHKGVQNSKSNVTKCSENSTEQIVKKSTLSVSGVHNTAEERKVSKKQTNKSNEGSEDNMCEDSSDCCNNQMHSPDVERNKTEEDRRKSNEMDEFTDDVISASENEIETTKKITSNVLKSSCSTEKSPVSENHKESSVKSDEEKKNVKPHSETCNDDTSDNEDISTLKDSNSSKIKTDALVDCNAIAKSKKKTVMSKNPLSNELLSESDDETSQNKETQHTSKDSLNENAVCQGEEDKSEHIDSSNGVDEDGISKEISVTKSSDNGDSGKSSLTQNGETTASTADDAMSEKAKDSEHEQMNMVDTDISEEERTALKSLLISSSSDDDDGGGGSIHNEDSASTEGNSSKKKRKIDSNEITKSEKCGPLSSKSIHYRNLHKKDKKNKEMFSDATEDVADDSSNEKRNKQDGDLPACEVILEKLPKDVFEKHLNSSEPSKERRSNESETDDIKKLINLKTLEPIPKKMKVPSADLDSTSDDDIDLNKRKVFRKRVHKNEELEKCKSLKDFHDDNGASSQSNHSDSSDNVKKQDGLKNIFEELLNIKNVLAKDMMLKSSSSDSDENETKDDTKEEEKKKEKMKKKSTKINLKKEKNEGTSGSDEENKKKKKWRKNKLLSMKLSETDTSEDEKKWKAKREREQQKEGKERKKSIARRVVISDSDEVQLLSSSDTSDSDSDAFVPSSKRKRKDASASKKSDAQSSSTGSNVSVKKKVKLRRIRKPISDSDNSDDGDGLNASQKSENTPNKGRKNIKRILKDDDVAEATRVAAKEEEERIKRIAERQKIYNALYSVIASQPETVDKVVLDFDPETKEELIQVDKGVASKLKPHQVNGIKFMWNACFESLEQAQKSEGSGCILAHCMGLGKTLQVIALVHTVLTCSKTNVKTVLIVCPLSTVLNWVSEFSKWLEYAEDDDIEVLELTKYKQIYERVGVLKHWQENGGVLILAYNLFRILANPAIRKQRKRNFDILQSSLVNPGPDLVICDEGHLLKNEKNTISKVINRLRTKRRIVLTGTPLQNNLLEYHCMVQFVKPNLLGTKKEFTNRFVNPINNGQFENSTAHDVKVMKRRAHVLHKMLDSSVQRYDYSVLTPFLPPKFEYVLLIRLTDLQNKLYKHYLENHSYRSTGEKKTRTAKLFSDFQAFQRIWTHPRVLKMNSDREEKKRSFLEDSDEGSLKDFIVSSSEESASSSDSNSDDVATTSKSKRITRSTVNNDSDEVNSVMSDKENRCRTEWWHQFISDESLLEDIHQSGKLSLVFKILQECEKIGDKVLIFSQSLLSLDLIEYFLMKIDEASNDDETLSDLKASWVLGLDYFRLDGSSSPENRSAWCKTFNREDNLRARLFLISTRAGGLGINLVASNRVILFDASWNPSYDLQSIFRVFRFGQKKPCYVYRFLAQHTMEEKIYNRQVTKLSLACRVVDEQQIERHYSMDDLQELYDYNPEEKNTEETPLVPKDVLLAELVKEKDSWINSYHEHDTLLENKEEEELNEEERKAAWEDYEKEKQGIRTSATTFFDNTAMITYLSKFGYSETQLRDRIIKENPTWSELQVNYHVNLLLKQMVNYISSEEYRKQVEMHFKGAQQPVLYQSPQTPGLRPILPRENLPTPQIQYQNQPVMQAHHLLNPGVSINQSQSNTWQNNSLLPTQSVPTTSLNPDSQHRIKVKSFGHLMNSNFGNSSKIVANPFATSTGSNVLHKTPNVNSNSILPGIAKPSTDKNKSSKSPTDVIEVE